MFPAKINNCLNYFLGVSKYKSPWIALCALPIKTAQTDGFLLTFREIDENSRGSEFDKEEPVETEVSPFLRRRSGGATAQPIVCPCQRKQRVCEESQVFMF